MAARKLGRRSARAAARAFLLEGPHALREALADPRRPVREVFASAEAKRAHARLLDGAGVPVHEVSEAVLAGLAETVTPQGLVAVVDFIDVPLDRVLGPGHSLVALLAEVRDPGNAGAILRSGDGAGVDGVVISSESVDPYNGKCVRSSAGSLFHVPFAVGVAAAEAVAAARAAGFAVLAADAAGECSVFEAELDRPTAWLFGNEAHGLSERLAALADQRVRVPIYGQAESLNLAAAAAVCLYASARALRGPGSGQLGSGDAGAAGQLPGRGGQPAGGEPEHPGGQ